VGRLTGLTVHDVVTRLRRLGFVFDGSARGSHEIWWNPITRARTTVPRHPGDLPEGTVRAIVRQAGVDRDAFLGA